MIYFEKEICEYLAIPSIPLKEWDGKTSFEKGVAVINLSVGGSAYAVASFNAEEGNSPSVVKTFSLEPFRDIEKVFIVPEYMNTDVSEMDLDEESRKAAMNLANEASDLENDDEGDKVEMPENEYFFDTIHDDEEARAFLQSYNARNRIKGKIPKNHDNIVARLGVIWREEQDKK